MHLNNHENACTRAVTPTSHLEFGEPVTKCVKSGHLTNVGG